MKIKVWKLSTSIPPFYSQTLHKTEEEAREFMNKHCAMASEGREFDEKGSTTINDDGTTIHWSNGETWRWEIREWVFEIPDPEPQPRKKWAFIINWGRQDNLKSPNVAMRLYDSREEAVALMNKAVEAEVKSALKLEREFSLTYENEDGVWIGIGCEDWTHWMVREMEVPV